MKQYLMWDFDGCLEFVRGGGCYQRQKSEEHLNIKYFDFVAV